MRPAPKTMTGNGTREEEDADEGGAGEDDEHGGS